MQIKLKWIGKDPTRIRIEERGEKVDIEPNEEFVVNEVLAKKYLKYDRRKFVIIEGEISAEGESELKKENEKLKDEIKELKKEIKELKENKKEDKKSK